MRENNTDFYFKLPGDLKTAFEEESERLGESGSAYIRQAIRDRLKKTARRVTRGE
jgi:predicted DNA-binding protein